LSRFTAAAAIKIDLTWNSDSISESGDVDADVLGMVRPLRPSPNRTPRLTIIGHEDGERRRAIILGCGLGWMTFSFQPNSSDRNAMQGLGTST